MNHAETPKVANSAADCVAYGERADVFKDVAGSQQSPLIPKLAALPLQEERVAGVRMSQFHFWLIIRG